jgi:integrase
MYHYRFMLNGKLERGSTKETALPAARDYVATLMVKLRANPDFDRKAQAPDLHTFAGQFLEHIAKRVESGDLDRDTQRTYQNGCRLLGATPVWDMRIDQIGRSHAAELSFPGSPSNANQALRTLSRILNYAAEVGIMTAAPKIPLRKEQERIVVIAPWLEELLLELSPYPLHAVQVVMGDCGMRPDEVCRMTWEHVYFADRQIYIPYGKTRNAKRYVGITERMAETLRAQKAQTLPRLKDSPWVFPSWKGKSHIANPKDAWQDLMVSAQAAIDKRKLPAMPEGLVLYSWRHTFATNFLRASNGDVGRLMALMGHSDMKTTMKYLHPSTAGAAMVMDRHNNEAKLEIVRKRA